MKQLVLLLMTVFIFSLPVSFAVMAQGDPVEVISNAPSDETIQFVGDAIVQFLISFLAFGAVLIAAYFMNGRQVNKETFMKSGARLSDVLDLLDRMDIPGADTYIHGLSEAIDVMIDDMGTSPELVLVKEKED